MGSKHRFRQYKSLNFVPVVSSVSQARVTQVSVYLGQYSFMSFWGQHCEIGSQIALGVQKGHSTLLVVTCKKI